MIRMACFKFAFFVAFVNEVNETSEEERICFKKDRIIKIKKIVLTKTSAK